MLAVWWWYTLAMRYHTNIHCPQLLLQCQSPSAMTIASIAAAAACLPACSLFFHVQFMWMNTCTHMYKYRSACNWRRTTLNVGGWRCVLISRHYKTRGKKRSTLENAHILASKQKQRPLARCFHFYRWTFFEWVYACACVFFSIRKLFHITHTHACMVLCVTMLKLYQVSFNSIFYSTLLRVAQLHISRMLVRWQRKYFKRKCVYDERGNKRTGVSAKCVHSDQAKIMYIEKSKNNEYDSRSQTKWKDGKKTQTKNSHDPSTGFAR